MADEITQCNVTQSTRLFLSIEKSLRGRKSVMRVLGAVFKTFFFFFFPCERIFVRGAITDIMKMHWQHAMFFLCVAMAATTLSMWTPPVRKNDTQMVHCKKFCVILTQFILEKRSPHFYL